MKFIASFFILILLASADLAGQVIPSAATKDSSVITTAKAEARPSGLKPAERRLGDGGFGMGLDYGGAIGIKATFYPVKYLGVFGATGYQPIGELGWNIGFLARAVPADGRHGARPYLKIMYGVNSSTTMSGTTQYDKLFYGFTMGIGSEFRFGRTRKYGLNVDLNLPLRTQAFFEQIDNMKKDPSVRDVKYSKVTISVGFAAEF